MSITKEQFFRDVMKFREWMGDRRYWAFPADGSPPKIVEAFGAIFHACLMASVTRRDEGTTDEDVEQMQRTLTALHEEYDRRAVYAAMMSPPSDTVVTEKGSVVDLSHVERGETITIVEEEDLEPVAPQCPKCGNHWHDLGHMDIQAGGCPHCGAYCPKEAREAIQAERRERKRRDGND